MTEHWSKKDELADMGEQFPVEAILSRSKDSFFECITMFSSRYNRESGEVEIKHIPQSEAFR